MFSIEDDFRLANFQLPRCDVALLYLIESIEGVSCHCAAAKMKQFRILGNLVYIWK